MDEFGEAIAMAKFNDGKFAGKSAYEDENGIPVPMKSVLVFSDILGYKQMVENAAKDGTSSNFLYDFRQAIYAAADVLGSEEEYFAFNFSDSVVMGWPIAVDAEAALYDTCLHVAAFQTMMTQCGYFIRSGVTVGEAYLDEYVQAGKAFIDAYLIEKDVAVYPRAALSKDAVEEVKQACSYYSDAEGCPLNTLFLGYSSHPS